MRPATLVLHRQLLRLAKGLVKSYEEWLNAVELEAKTAVNDSPKHA